MATRITLWTLILAVACGGTAFAHGANTDIMGTVTARNAEQLTIKDRDGKVMTVGVTEKTEYRQGDSPAVAGDLKVGDRVFVEAAGKVGAYTAAEIRFSSTAPPAVDEDHHHGHDD